MQELSIAQVWSQGDFVIRATAIILLAMSLASWIVILMKGWDLFRLKAMLEGCCSTERRRRNSRKAPRTSGKFCIFNPRADNQG